LLTQLTILTSSKSTKLKAQERLFLACKLKNSGSFHTVWRSYIWFDPLEGTARYNKLRRVMLIASSYIWFDPLEGTARKADEAPPASPAQLHLVRPVRGYCKLTNP